MIDAVRTATAGMTQAADRFGSAARTVASGGTAALAPADRVDLSGAAAELIGSKSAFALNAAVARTADRMTGQLLDVSA
jgi:flagellar hook protein FlgE